MSAPIRQSSSDLQEQLKQSLTAGHADLHEVNEVFLNGVKWLLKCTAVTVSNVAVFHKVVRTSLYSLNSTHCNILTLILCLHDIYFILKEE